MALFSAADEQVLTKRVLLGVEYGSQRGEGWVNYMNSDVMISIVLPAFTDQDNLDRIIGEFIANQPDNSWEVIVVDDGSPKPLELVSTAPDRFKLFRNESRSGAASARNTGIKHAQGDFIVLLSVFLKIPANYVSQLSSFIETHTFDVAQHLLVKETELVADHFQDFLVDQSGRIANAGGNLPVKNAQFGAALLKKSIYNEVDGFDESMDHYGGHELDLAYRLDQKGYSKRIIIENLPLERVTLESHVKVRTKLQEYGRVGLPALLMKHPELERTILTYPFVWSLLKMIDLPKSMERRFKRRIEQDLELTRRQYRLYLHLIVRNAWDAR
ncbi:MAG: glycosyltransferase family 2 protein [FCB group bacterium]|nr:glycosyltransferase family 2 protein [FCB group bacterium]MBL7027273.1 glycosyltransferase family 2 protein [Candidatus Neomarinimicrobiota bacterium]MBL7122243.1 glycosyltransferase family 2 protein [Candidatus Neomarinimicrobiota bacterium]